MDEKNNLRSGPLPVGWHRVSWTEMNHPKYVVTEDMISAVLAYGVLGNKHTVTDLKIEGWESYEYEERPSIEIKHHTPNQGQQDTPGRGLRWSEVPAKGWVAEHVPAYMVDSSEEKPWMDENVAMSAPQVLFRGSSYFEAAKTVADYMDECAKMDHIMRSGESRMMREIARVFMASTDTMNHVNLEVRVHGRYYRIREQ